jgi:membrane protein implicated in regulation of membrane protease activity
MKAKDALVGFLFWLGILAFVFFVASADSLPMWVLLILAAIAWVAYILIVIRDYQRAKRRAEKPQFYVRGPGGRLVPLDSLPSPQDLYDQEADKR